MARTFDIPVNASANRTWQVVGEQFGDIDEWSDNISESHLEGELGAGAIRVCTSSQAFGPFKAAVVKEKLLSFDRETQSFSYQAIEGLPSFMAVAKNHWQVISVAENQSIVRLSPTLKLAWFLAPFTGLLFWMMRKDLQSFSQQLKAAIEQE